MEGSGGSLFLRYKRRFSHCKLCAMKTDKSVTQLHLRSVMMKGQGSLWLVQVTVRRSCSTPVSVLSYHLKDEEYFLIPLSDHKA